MPDAQSLAAARRRRRRRLVLDLARPQADDLDPTSRLRRTRTPVAAVRGFLWASSPRQATLLLTMTVQQELTTVEAIAAEALRIRRDRRRDLLHDTLMDLAGGARSLGEIDVKRECRRRRLTLGPRDVIRSVTGSHRHV